MPDWRKAEDYAFLEKEEELPSKVWAWEFLRRSKEYRSGHEEYLEEANNLEKQFGAGWLSDSTTFRHDLPLEDGENCVDWVLRCEEAGVRARRIPLDAFYGKPFHLDGLFDPMNTPGENVLFIDPHSFPRVLTFPDETDEFVKNFETYGYMIPEGDETHLGDGVAPAPREWMPDGGGATAFDHRFLVAVFDLQLAFDDQVEELKTLKERLLERRGMVGARLPSVKLPVWTRYLRVLDAGFEEATIEEIADIFWPEPGENDDPVGQVKETRKQALWWTKPHRYVRLLY
tara:strand:+ start:107 stop:967 length:861 start_codon:yes stop_codon:yes gene_type:complete